MMKWGRKKKPSSASVTSSSSSSSTHPHLISHVFPLSWFSKTKHTNPKPASRVEKLNQKSKYSSPNTVPKSLKSSNYAYNKFYTQDEEGFWQLSFGDHNNNHPTRYCSSYKSNPKQPTTKRRTRETSKKHNDRDPSRQQVLKDDGGNKEESLQRTYRRIMEATSELHKELGQVTEGCRRSVEKEILQQEIEHATSEWEKLKEAKLKEFLTKSEKQRKSIHISSRESYSSHVTSRVSSRQGVRVQVKSPRTPSKAETCKIKALEDMKKLKMKKLKMKEIAPILEMEDRAAALDGFPVVKCSCDPQQDFRDSMLEMIMEKKLTSPEELEELLACYLTLNADEYHDLIIKVFRQVWCELVDP